MEFNFLILKQVGILSPLVQVALMTALFVLTICVQFRIFRNTGKLSHNYPVNTFLFLAPIYEEVIFRGLLFGTFITLFGDIWSIIITSLLFGIWHIRSIFFMTKTKVVVQILYTGLLLGPIFSIITIATGSIWIAVILHFLNNLLAPVLENRKFFISKNIDSRKGSF